MVHSSVPADTDPLAYQVLVERWRSMGIDGRASLIERLCSDVDRLARAGIAAQHPNFTERDICRELARRRYGDELSDAAYAGRGTRS
jgi:hypothetical protein